MIATTSRSTTVLAGLADIRGWQEEFYRDLHQPSLSPPPLAILFSYRPLSPRPPLFAADALCQRSLRGSWLFAQKMLEACQAVNAAP